MISISGIKYQRELEMLPFFNKKAALLLIGKEGKNLDKKIERLIEIGYFIVLKKGFYTTSTFYDQADKELYLEYLANNLRSPSYLSLEYVLAKEGLIPEAVFGVTSITSKTPRIYVNPLGNFIYKNIKSRLFTGYLTKNWEGKNIYVASPAKALFDFLYLKSLRNIREDMFNLRINWGNFSQKDLTELKGYVNLSKSKKMFLILKEIISKSYVS